MYSWADCLRYGLVVVRPGDISRGAGLRLADEGGVVVVQNVHRLQQGDDSRRYNGREKNKVTFIPKRLTNCTCLTELTAQQTGESFKTNERTTFLNKDLKSCDLEAKFRLMINRLYIFQGSVVLSVCLWGSLGVLALF